MIKCVGDFINIDMQLLSFEKAFHKKSIKSVHTLSTTVYVISKKGNATSILSSEQDT